MIYIYDIYIYMIYIYIRYIYIYSVICTNVIVNIISNHCLRSVFVNCWEPIWVLFDVLAGQLNGSSLSQKELAKSICNKEKYNVNNTM